MNSGDKLTLAITTVCVVVGGLLVGLIIYMLATTTHETALHDNDRKEKVAVTCLQNPNNTPLECRVMVDGTP